MQGVVLKLSWCVVASLPCLMRVLNWIKRVGIRAEALNSVWVVTRCCPSYFLIGNLKGRARLEIQQPSMLLSGVE